MRMRRLVSLCLCLAAAPATAADICKWVDGAGRIQYSDIMPADRPCQQVIRVMHADPEEQRRAIHRRTQLFERLKNLAEERDKARSDPERAQREAEERRARCQDAKEELRFLETAYGMRLVRPGRDGGDEEPLVWLDDQAREELTESWRKQVEHWCGSSAAEAPGPTPERAYGAPPPKRMPAPRRVQ